MAHTSVATLTSTDVHDVTTDKQGTLGQKAQTADGRVYRYAKNGATALAAGAKVKAGATAAVTSTTKEALQVADSLVPTAATVSDPAAFEDGLFTVSNAKYLAGGVAKDGTVSLVDRLDAPVTKGATTKLEVNKFCDVVVTTNNDEIGVAEVAVPANAYFWAFVSL